MPARPPLLDGPTQERIRLMRAYKQAKRAQMLELYADPMHGEWLRRFIETLNHFGIEHDDRFVEFVQKECRKWLAVAPENIRFAALEAVGERIQIIRMQNGLPAFDDPIEGKDVFLLSKEAIGL